MSKEIFAVFDELATQYLDKSSLTKDEIAKLTALGELVTTCSRRVFDLTKEESLGTISQEDAAELRELRLERIYSNSGYSQEGSNN